MTTKTQNIWFAALLSVLTLGTYYPALERFFVSDQIGYFVELGGDRSLWQGLRLCDYSASREFDKGDQLLYRPLLFAWLAVENSLFHYDYYLWNLTQLGVHVVVCFCLYLLLNAITPSRLAFVFAALFCVLSAHFEMVTWNHVGGYMIAAALMLLAWTQVQHFLADRDASPAFLRRYVLLMTCATFFHEAMVPLVFLTALYVVVMRRRTGRPLPVRTLAFLLVPAFVFFAFYAVHCLSVDRLFHVAGRSKTVWELLANSFRLVEEWTLRPFLPWVCTYAVAPFRRMAPASRFDGHTQVMALFLVLFLGLVILMLQGFSARLIRARVPWLLLLVGALLAFAAILNLGRSFFDIVDMGSYYLYFFCLLVLVGVYSCLCLQEMSKPSSGMLCVILLVFLGMNAAISHGQSRKVAEVNRVACDYFTAVDAFVREHSAEADFSFAAGDIPPQMDPPFILNRGYGDAPDLVGPLHISELLYLRYYRAVRPRYVLARDLHDHED